MAKKTKESHPFSIRMEKNTFERLDKFCQNSGLTKTVAVEKAVNIFIEDYELKMKKASKK